MKKLSLLLCLFFVNLTSSYAAVLDLESGKYTIDPDHTRISFLIDHFVVSRVEGRFDDVKGFFSLSNQIEDCKIDVTIPTSSIDTGVPKRDDDLRSSHFFDVKLFPNMTFKSKAFSGTLQGFTVTGDLTIKGVTKEITLLGKYTGSIKDPTGKLRAAVRAEGHINRKDFNIMYNDMIEAGPAIGDMVTIQIISEGIKDVSFK